MKVTSVTSIRIVPVVLALAAFGFLNSTVVHGQNGDERQAQSSAREPSVYRPGATASTRSPAGSYRDGSLISMAPPDTAWATDYIINPDGSLGPLATTTMTYDQLRAHRRRKAEQMAWTDGAYGTAEYVPRRQRALDRVIQQAKTMQYSQRMVDEIASALQLQDYVDYEYDVRYGRDVDAWRARERARILAERRRAERQAARVEADLARREDDIAWFGEDHVRPDERDPAFVGDPGDVRTDPERPPHRPFGPIDDEDVVGRGFERMMDMLDERYGPVAQELPADVIASLEASVHNAVLDRLRSKGFNVAALNVFLHSMGEVKVIVIITTSELPQSAIRQTLRQVRATIERDVLQARFPSLSLAQLSSFTILNEVDNHFYEHPVLYWQLRTEDWATVGQPVRPVAPGPGERIPRAEPGPDADRLLEEFLEIYGDTRSN